MEGRKGLGEGEEGKGGEREWGREWKGGSWGNSALVVGGIDAPACHSLQLIKCCICLPRGLPVHHAFITIFTTELK